VALRCVKCIGTVPLGIVASLIYFVPPAPFLAFFFEKLLTILTGCGLLALVNIVLRSCAADLSHTVPSAIFAFLDFLHAGFFTFLSVARLSPARINIILTHIVRLHENVPPHTLHILRAQALLPCFIVANKAWFSALLVTAFATRPAVGGMLFMMLTPFAEKKKRGKQSKEQHSGWKLKKSSWKD